MKHLSPLLSPWLSLTSSSWTQSRDLPLCLHPGCTRDPTCSHQPPALTSPVPSLRHAQESVGGASLAPGVPWWNADSWGGHRGLCDITTRGGQAHLE